MNRQYYRTEGFTGEGSWQKWRQNVEAGMDKACRRVVRLSGYLAKLAWAAVPGSEAEMKVNTHMASLEAH